MTLNAEYCKFSEFNDDLLKFSKKYDKNIYENILQEK